MKRLLALIFVLCVFCAGAASAETVTSEGGVLDIGDGIALLTERGMVYTRNDDPASDIALTIYPYAYTGDMSSNINFTPFTNTYEADVDIVNGAREILKQSAISSYESAGVTVQAFECGSAFDVVIGSEPGVALDIKTTGTYLSVTYTVMQRQIYIGSKGRTISLTAADTETLDRMTKLLSSLVIWY